MVDNGKKALNPVLLDALKLKYMGLNLVISTKPRVLILLQMTP
jgi:hypothetical protein